MGQVSWRYSCALRSCWSLICWKAATTRTKAAEAQPMCSWGRTTSRVECLTSYQRLRPRLRHRLPRQRRPRLPIVAIARNMRSVVSALLNQEQAFLLVSLFARETAIAIALVRIQHLVQNAPRHAPGP